ncbi:MAG: peroxidase family protein [Fuerstiella sp.]
MKSSKRNRRRTNRRKSAWTAGEAMELRQMLSAVMSTVEESAIDGVGNNAENEDWGSTDIELIRLSEADYADGIEAPSGEDRPNAREISNAIANQEESVLNDRQLTDYLWIWGQFLDHDIDLSEGADPAEDFSVEVPLGDPLFDPFGTGTVEIPLSRTVYVDGDDSSDGQRQQINQITAFLDGSVIYGSDEERAEELRTHEGGLLKTSDGDLLPFNEAGLENAGGTSETLFLAGDIRANENVALSSMHTIFVREHNRIATELAAQNPDLTDEELYQQARSIVAAELQVITYNEFLPALLGSDALSEYSGYDSSVNPSIANEFSTAAYRFGHSLLSPELVRLNEDGSVIDDGNLSLSDAFFSPDELTDNGIDSILRGAATQLAQELDSQVVDDVRNFLFGPPGAGGLDLVSLNIQRGRDHGLADYNSIREDLGLDPIVSFSQITSDVELAAALEATYGSVDNIDLWVAGLAEDHLEGSSLGETFTTIIVDQFERLRDGDSHWYQNVFEGQQLHELESTTLADIIERNSDVTGLQDNIFFAADAQPIVEHPTKEQPGDQHRKDKDSHRQSNDAQRRHSTQHVGPQQQNQDAQRRLAERRETQRRSQTSQRQDQAVMQQISRAEKARQSAKIEARAAAQEAVTEDSGRNNRQRQSAEARQRSATSSGARINRMDPALIDAAMTELAQDGQLSRLRDAGKGGRR